MQSNFNNIGNLAIALKRSLCLTKVMFGALAIDERYKFSRSRFRIITKNSSYNPYNRKKSFKLSKIKRRKFYSDYQLSIAKKGIEWATEGYKNETHS